MTIEAELADGRILEFPDGTDPSVIQSTVKKVMGIQEPGLLDTIGTNLVSGFKSTGLGAGAAAAHYLGAEEKAKEWDAARQRIQEEQAAHGGDTFAGKVAGAVGSMAPALVAAPFTGGSSLLLEVANAGLFALPAFRDTYEARKAEGDSDALAISQALAAAGIAQFGGKAVGKGGTAVGKALGEGQGALKQVGVAGLEGAGFSAASTATEKAIDELAGKKTDTAWLNPEDMAVQAAAMGLLRVPHLKGKPAPEATPRSEVAMTPEQEAALDARLKAREEAKATKALPAPEPVKALPAPEAQVPERPEVMDREMWAKGPKAAEEPTLAPDVATPQEMKAEEARAQEAPTAPTTGFTHEDLAAFGTTYGKAARTWADKNLIGKTKEDVQAMVAADPTLAQGKGHVASLLREITAPEPTKYEATTPDLRAAQGEAPAATPDNAPAGTVAGLLSGPNREVPATRVQEVKPDGNVAAGADVGKPAAGEGKQPPALEETLKEPTDVSEAPEAKQAEAQGPEPAAPAEPVKPKFTAQEMLQRAEEAQRKADAEAAAKRVIDSKESADAALQEILDDRNAPKALKNQAFEFMDAMDPTSEHYAGDMDTAADRQAMLDSVRKFVESAKAKRFNVGEAHPEGVSLHPDAAAALRSNDLVGALHHISQNSESKFARAVADRLKHLLPRTHVHMHDELKTDSGATARGAASADGHHIWLHTKHGMDEETLLHEAVHAATERVLSTDPAKLTQAQRDAVGELKSLWNAAKQDKATNLSPEARASLSEFVSEGMTNPALQKALQAKPWKSQTRWDGFKRVILKMLGVSQPKSMLDMHAAAVDTIFERPKAEYQNPLRKFAISRDMQDIIDNSGATDAETKSLLARAMAGFKDSDLPILDKFRTQATDIAASIESRINKGGNEREGFNGAVRDSLGRLNPMGLYRQAQDYAKMILGYLEKGALVKDASTGMWKVENAKEGGAPIEVYKKLQEWGRNQGMDYAQASHAASRILEGVRLHALREEIRKGNSDVTLHAIDKSKGAPSIDQQIDIAMREYKAHPELQEVSRLMDNARIKLIDHMVAVGRLSDTQGQQWKSVAGYVPFDRVVEFSERLASQKRIGSRTPLGVGALPELLGSDIHRVGNVFDNYMNTMGWMMGQIMNTDARNQTLKTLQEMGYAKRMGFRPNGARNATYGFEKGEKVYYNLPSKYDVMAFKDLTAPKGQVVKFLSQFSHVLRTTVTALPPFALKQVTDDIQRAIMTSGVKNPLALTARVLANFPRIAWAEFTGKSHPEMEGLGSYGVTGGFDFLEGKPAANLLADLGYKPRGKLAGALHRLEGITRASDFAVRKAVYDQTLKESGGDELLAQTRARELINFRRRGASDFMATATATIPFFNAYVQGMDVLLRAATGKASAASIDKSQARAMFVSRAAIVTGLATMYALAKSDDDEYKDVDLRTRNNNWLLGNGLKLPVPGELGAIFKSIPEHVVEYYKRQGTPEEQTAMEAIESSMGYIFEQFGGRVVPIPQAVKPLLEAFTNHSFLTGNQLEGIHQQGMLRHMRVNERTSELAIQIAKFTADQIGVEVSPIMIDNVLQGYFGSTAAMASMMTDQMLNPDRMDRPLNKWALVSNYMLDPVGTRRVGEFYDEREKVFQLQNTLNELAKKDINAAEKFVDAHANELATYSAVNATLQQLEKTRAYKNYLSSRASVEDGMSQEDRAKETLEVRKMEVELVQWLREVKTDLRRNPI